MTTVLLISDCNVRLQAEVALMLQGTVVIASCESARDAFLEAEKAFREQLVGLGLETRWPTQSLQKQEAPAAKMPFYHHRRRY